MPLESKKSRIVLFFAFGVGLALLMAGLKAAIAWAAHTYLYSVPWVGGFLRSIELLEVSNLFVFAILGVGIGAATLWLPRGWAHRANLSFLLVLSPFVLSASYVMQQNIWIKDVAAKGNVPFRDARTITNAYLKREVGSGGFWGFYPFSTQLAELPTRLDSLSAEKSINPNKLLSQELASYNDPRADMAAYVFERVGWLIRLMYITIAALTGLIYYFKGHSWAENRAIASTGATPPTAPTRPTPRKKPPHVPKPPHSPKNSPSQGPQPSSEPLGNLANQPVSNPANNPANNLPGHPVTKPYVNSPPDMPLNGSVPKPPSRPLADSDGESQD